MLDMELQESLPPKKPGFSSLGRRDFGQLFFGDIKGPTVNLPTTTASKVE